MASLTLVLTTPKQWLDFTTTTDAVRRDVERKLELLEPVLALPRGHLAAIDGLARRTGISVPTLRRWYYAARRGNWQELADLRRDSQLWDRAGVGLPVEDIETARQYIEQNQRKAAPAIRKMCKDWRLGKIHTTQPVDPRTGLPVGWSESNLKRLASTKFELKVARIGRSAAFDSRPLVLTTRVGLEFGEYFMYDDDEYDQEVTYLGVSNRVMRGLGLSGIEVLTDCHAVVSFKPCLWDEEAEKKKKLLQRDMHLLVAHQLINVGYRAKGTTIVMEHGTANTSKEFVERIAIVTNGAVSVRRSGIEGRQAHAAMFEGRSHGNFRFKAQRESMGNLIRNEAADLVEMPGQVGKDRLHCPEATWGGRRYTEILLKAASQMQPEHAAQLAYPRLDFPTWCERMYEVYDRVDRRGENEADGHALEGWLQCGFIAHEYRLQADSQQWLPWTQVLALPGPQQAAIEALVKSDPLLWRTRKLSPREVYQRNLSTLVRCPASVLPVLLPEPEYWREVTVRDDHTVTIVAEQGQDATTYLARRSDESYIRPGTKLRAWVLPAATGGLPVGDATGRWLDVLPAIARACRNDAEAIARSMGFNRKVEGQLLAPVVRRANEQLRANAEMRRHNAAVIAAAGGGSGAPASTATASMIADQAALLARRSSAPAPAPAADWL
jgi:hypothetical protein